MSAASAVALWGAAIDYDDGVLWRFGGLLVIAGGFLAKWGLELLAGPRTGRVTYR